MSIYETTLKVSGWNLRIKAIGSFIVGTILLLGGIIGSVLTLQPGWLILSVIGIIALLGGWSYWARSKSLVEGKFYSTN